MDTLGTVFSALSDPTRRAIIGLLAAGPARVTDIAEPFSVSLNAVSKHLKMLERAGLVRRVRQGRDHILTFEGKPLRDVGLFNSRVVVNSLRCLLTDHCQFDILRFGADWQRTKRN